MESRMVFFMDECYIHIWSKYLKKLSTITPNDIFNAYLITMLEISQYVSKVKWEFGTLSHLAQ